MKKLNVLIAAFLMMSCSGDDNSSGEDEMGGLDLTEVSGMYSGSWVWEFGTGAISMEIMPSTSNRYIANLYGTSNFQSMFTSDATPEGVGDIIVEGTDASVNIAWNVDFPPCSDNYTGSGTRMNDGVLELNVDIPGNAACGQGGVATWTLRKIRN